VDVPIWAWVTVVGFVVVVLATDLLLLHRRTDTISMRRAAFESALWVLLGVAFGGLVWVVAGSEQGAQYFAGYLTEKALSVDNLFLFAAILGAFAVPAIYQRRVLFWGVIGALLTRGVFVAAGATLLAHLSWAIELFGVLVLLAAGGLVRPRARRQPGGLRVLRVIRKVFPTTDDFNGPRFLARMTDGAGRARWAITPLLVALIAIELADVVMAVDSVPAVFGVTRVPFLVFTSNVFAVIGLRALYFLLVGALDRLEFLRFGLAAILAFVGAKMLLSGAFDLPVWVSLVVIVAVLAVTAAASLWCSRDPLGLGQRHDDAGSLAGRASGLDRSAVGPHQLCHDRQADAAPARPTRSTAPPEPLEDVVDVVASQPYTRVGHLQARRGVDRADVERDAPP
jgi:tellurite resistance protein TerC